MKGLEKLTSIRLAEVLTQKAVVPNEAITDALYAQDRRGGSFVELIVSGGNITEWDVAKIVVEAFQVPFVMASNYEVSEEVKNALPKKWLFENLIVPLDVFDHVITIAMPILTPFEVMARVRKKLNCHVFPYVGLISENRKVLSEMFPDFAEWMKAEEKAREARAVEKKRSGPAVEGDWTNIFDSADAQVRDALDK